jgi:hypothetical protein
VTIECSFVQLLFRSTNKWADLSLIGTKYSIRPHHLDRLLFFANIFVTITHISVLNKSSDAQFILPLLKFFWSKNSSYNNRSNLNTNKQILTLLYYIWQSHLKIAVIFRLQFYFLGEVVPEVFCDQVSPGPTFLTFTSVTVSIIRNRSHWSG